MLWRNLKVRLVSGVMWNLGCRERLCVGTIFSREPLAMNSITMSRGSPHTRRWT